MKVAGLFVGVSRVADPGIKELQFAHSDATALHAVFADGNLELGAPEALCHLLVDEGATKANVLEALARTVADANAGEADIVVVHFSCHGSPAGTLVAHDTERGAVDSTGIPVAELVQALSAVRGRPVVLTLDCCFAGTALGMTDSPNRQAFNDLMHDFQAESRLVGCAADFGQKAYEDKEYGKGIFTHALLSRAREAFDAGDRDLSAFDWLHDAVQRTGALAQTRGRTQSPTAFATVRSAQASIRIAKDRPNQLRLVVPEDLPPVSGDVGSLAGHGLDPATIQALRQRLGTDGELNQLQRDAVQVGGILRHQSVFVRAPTSAGKTLVAELAILGHQRTGRKAVVLLPLRALAREHARTFTTAYASLGLRVIVSTGDSNDDDDLLIRGQFEVAFLTFEKFSAITSARPELQESLGLVVFDEIQTIADNGRGHTLELLLVQMRRLRARSRWPQIVVLCGELADLGPLQQWLNLPVVASRHRPIPLEEGVIRVSTGEVRIRDREAGTERRENWVDAVATPTENDDRARRISAAVPVVRSLLARDLQVLVFCSEKPQARRMARRLASVCQLPAQQRLVDQLDGLDASTEHRTRGVLREIARGGVGLHSADLTDEERNVVEDAFRSRALRVLVATSTLGQGVNLPADAVVLVDDIRFNGICDELVGQADYRNMAGRAGRLIADGPERGLAILVAQNQHGSEELWARYVVAPPASLGSSLGRLANEDLVLLLLRQFESATVNELTGALADTYWALSERVDSRWRRERRAEIESSLTRLADVGLVAQVGDTGWALTPLGRTAAGFGLTWKSADRIAKGVQALRHEAATLDTLALIVLALETTEIEDCRCPRGPSQIPSAPSPRLAGRPALWALLTDSSSGADVGDRFHKLRVIDSWLSGKGLHDVEGQFARGGNDDIVAGLFYVLLGRLGSILPAVAAVARLGMPVTGEDPRELARRVRLQLSIGGGKDVAALHRLRLGLSRGQCLKLVEIGIRNLADLQRALLDREDELAAFLSTPALQRIQAALADSRYRTRLAAQESQLALDGFD